MRAMKLSEPVPGSMRQIRLAAFGNNRARRVLSCAFPTRRSSTTALLRFQGAESGDSRGAAGARSQQFAMARGYYCSLTTALCNEHGSTLGKVLYRYVSSESHRGLHNVGNKNGIGRGRSPFGTVLIGCRHVLEPNVTVGSTAAVPAAPAARCLPQLAWLQTDAASGRCDGDGSSTQNKSNKDGQSTSHGDVKVGRGGANGSNPNRDRRADEDGWGTADDEAKQRGEGASAEKDQEAGGAARLNAIRDKLRDVGVDATEDAKDWIRERRDGVDEMKEVRHQTAEDMQSVQLSLLCCRESKMSGNPCPTQILFSSGNS